MKGIRDFRIRELKGLAQPCFLVQYRPRRASKKAWRIFAAIGCPARAQHELETLVELDLLLPVT